MQLASGSEADHKFVFLELRQNGKQGCERFAYAARSTPEEDLSVFQSLGCCLNKLHLFLTNFIVLRKFSFLARALRRLANAFGKLRKLVCRYQKSATVSTKTVTLILF